MLLSVSATQFVSVPLWYTDTERVRYANARLTACVEVRQGRGAVNFVCYVRERVHLLGES